MKKHTLILILAAASSFLYAQSGYAASCTPVDKQGRACVSAEYSTKPLQGKTYHYLKFHNSCDATFSVRAEKTMVLKAGDSGKMSNGIGPYGDAELVCYDDSARGVICAGFKNWSVSCSR